MAEGSPCGPVEDGVEQRIGGGSLALQMLVERIAIAGKRPVAEVLPQQRVGFASGAFPQVFGMPGGIQWLQTRPGSFQNDMRGPQNVTPSSRSI